jgi:RNA 2',3'-cyclic 3'-phosphodiesterase
MKRSVQNPPEVAAEKKIRLFTAIGIPPETLSKAAAIQEKLQKGSVFTGAHPKWVQPESIHITLVFLGWQDPERVGDVREVMDAVAPDFSAFELSIGSVHLFPDEKNPKVISIGLARQVEVVSKLQAKLRDGLDAAGFETEDRAFRPHVTLARISSRKGLAGLKGVVKAHHNASAGRFSVDRITLFQSTLSGDGARYDVLHESPLKTLAAPGSDPTY